MSIRYILCLHFRCHYDDLDWYKCVGWTSNQELAEKFRTEQPDPEAEESYYLKANTEDSHVYHKQLLDGTFDGSEVSESPERTDWKFVEDYVFDGTDLTRQLRQSGNDSDDIWEKYETVIDTHEFTYCGMYVDIKTQEAMMPPGKIVELISWLYDNKDIYKYLDLSDCLSPDIKLLTRAEEFATYAEIPDLELKNWSDILRAL